MKKLLFLGLPFLVYGFEVQFSKTFSHEMLPDELSTSINISSEKKNEKDVLSSLDVYNKFIQKSNKIEKSSNSITLFPQYKYKEGEAIFIGYKGSVNYKITALKSKNMKEFLEEFYEIKHDSDLTISLSALKWNFSKESMEKSEELLRLEAIKWSQNYAKKLSKDLRTQCSTKQIMINQNSVRPRVYANEMSMSKTSSNFSMPLPELLNEEQTLNANIILECN